MILYGYSYLRPEALFTLQDPPPASLGSRLWGILSDLWWAFLTVIAPTLPIVGAAVGYTLARALLP